MMTLKMMSAKNKAFLKFIFSPSKTTPTTTAPIAPMPVQIAYATDIAIVCIA